eukprot:1995326-Rhodomonas_salina.1
MERLEQYAKYCQTPTRVSVRRNSATYTREQELEDAECCSARADMIRAVVHAAIHGVFERFGGYESTARLVRDWSRQYRPLIHLLWRHSSWHGCQLAPRHTAAAVPKTQRKPQYSQVMVCCPDRQRVAVPRNHNTSRTI